MTMILYAAAIGYGAMSALWQYHREDERSDVCFLFSILLTIAALLSEMTP